MATLRYITPQNPVILPKSLEDNANISIKNDSGKTPLHKASETTNEVETYDIFKLLLEKGSDCNDIDADGSTAFHSASETMNLQIVKLLLQFRADIEAVNKFGETAIHYAAENPHADVLEFILDQGFDSNQMDDCGRTPLHQAAMHNKPEGCRILLMRGSMIDKKNCGR